MDSYRYKSIPLIFAFLFILATGVYSQNRDNLPAEYREYTNPEEVVTFDRTTPFARAIDVINQFAQKFRDKLVINRTEVSGNIGISVPAMHWMDALKLILRVKELQLVEKKEFFEIVTKESLQQDQMTQAAAGGGGAQSGGGGEGQQPIATTNTHEVRINAIFFEGNRRALKEIGVDWSTISENVPDAILGGGQGGSGQGGGGQGGQGGQGGGQSLPNSQFDGPFVQVNSKGAQNVSQDVFNALINVGEIGNTGIDVQALFSAFEANNLGEVLASPTVKVMDGQEGRIQVGQDFSIKQRDIAGNVVEQFFSVGTILTVTPQVITQQDTTFVHLDIQAERSSAQPDPVSTIINKQQAQTQALLLDGESTVIAGLYSQEKSEVRRGVPILKDLPPWFFGLRYLFGYSSKDVQMRELVILIEASLEPTIPERYGDDFDNKYEVLQDEREQMREELKQSDRLLKEKDVKEDEPQNERAEEPDTSAQDRQQDRAEQRQEKETAQQDTSDKQQMNAQKEKQEEAPAISDPEVKTKKVQINLGGNTANSDSGSIAAQPTDGETSSDSTMTQQQKAMSNSAQNSTSATYYLVGGSFEVEENALDFRNKLRDDGYNAAIINMNGSDIMLVAYHGYNQLGEARSALKQIQQNQNSEAWLYKAN